MEIINEDVRKLVNAAILERDLERAKLRRMERDALEKRCRSFYNGKYPMPDFCSFDAEEWGYAICQDCEMSGDRCCEDWYSDKCPRQSLVEECEVAAFEANERIFELLRGRL